MQQHVAVQFFGHPRSFKKTYKTFKEHIIEPNEKLGISVDVFIHTWSELEHTDARSHYKIDKNRSGKPLEKSDLEWIYSNYKPKAIIVEEQQPLTPQESDEAARHNIRDKISKNMSLTFYQANILREKYEEEHDFKYDLVLATRPDIIFYQNLVFENIFRDFKRNEIENLIFFADIPMLSVPKYNTNFRQFIVGIDLLLLGGRGRFIKLLMSGGRENAIWFSIRLKIVLLRSLMKRGFALILSSIQNIIVGILKGQMKSRIGPSAA